MQSAIYDYLHDAEVYDGDGHLTVNTEFHGNRLDYVMDGSPYHAADSIINGVRKRLGHQGFIRGDALDGDERHVLDDLSNDVGYDDFARRFNEQQRLVFDDSTVIPVSEHHGSGHRQVTIEHNDQTVHSATVAILVALGTPTEDVLDDELYGNAWTVTKKEYWIARDAVDGFLREHEGGAMDSDKLASGLARAVMGDLRESNKRK